MKPLSTGDPLRLGPYRLLGVLGEGGMGKVYVGQDAAGTVSAVKVLHPELAHEQNLAQRFVREAQAAQAVTSRGVARVLGAQTEGGRPWIATEFLAGPTLDQAVKAHGPFGDAALRSLSASLASTLADIHATGLIHRDLKPQNIVLTSGGPRIIDFGIARPEHGLTLTTTGQVPVTPGYGAPEQVLGKRVAAPADVFSLGAVLVYAASGERAFDGGHVAALQYEVVHGEPRLDGIPEALRALIAPCLAKDPAARPTPAQIVTGFAPPRGADRVWKRGALASDIKERERSVKELTTVTSGAGPGRPLARRRLLIGLTAGGVAVAGSGGAGAWWLSSKRSQESRFAFPRAVATPKANVLSADNGDYIAGEPPKALWKHERVLDLESPAVLPVRDVVVFGGVDGGLVAHNVVDGKRRWTAPEVECKARFLSLSDRLVAAVDEEGTLRTYVPSTGEPKWTARVKAESLLAADGEAVYLATEDGELRSVRRSDARVRWTRRVPRGFGKVLPPGIAGGGRLVVSTEDGHVLALDTSDGSKAWEVREQSDGLIRPARYRNTVYLGGVCLTARAITDGAELWSKTSRDAYGEQETWGPPIASANAVYAAHGAWPSCRRANDGAKVLDGRSSCMVGSPLTVQANSLWSVGEEEADQVNAVYAEDGRVLWDYPVPGDPGEKVGRWLVGGGNRVFVMNDTALFVLPVA
ncbi:Serine/threonine protein kinase [Streptomyces sp. WMMB 714]|uniref:serine/threonine-protein kinase n=1 Tax=Streptomyces sp. WMMB 714 TaxID=1286822 RepID=UPI0005F8568C|nr:serine/threonine-protein kinase [Streptomyces sp. WMMB 714]SCK19251.1 Serine/threonine protein kinase [Streptomyces sp. WMMB 714]